MSFWVTNNKLLQKLHQNVVFSISNLINIEFDSESFYRDNDKYTKVKVNSYGDKVNNNFQHDKIPKENASYDDLSLIVLDSFIRVIRKYYPQTLLEECKYKIKKNEKYNFINDGLEPDIESDTESDNDKSSD